MRKPSEMARTANFVAEFLCSEVATAFVNNS
jgi:hypothetical protein